jgi:hypothetical protein
VNEATSRALLESRALRHRLAASLRSAEVGLTSLGRPSGDDQLLLQAELELIEEAQRLLLKPCRGLS